MALRFKNAKLGNFIDPSVLESTYSVKEVLEAMPQLQQQTLYNMIKRGDLRSIKNGRHIRIYKDNFEGEPEAVTALDPRPDEQQGPKKPMRAKKGKGSKTPAGS